MKERPQLGLVCITASDAVRYRSMTRKRLLQLAKVEQKSAVRQLYAENLSRLERRKPHLYSPARIREGSHKRPLLARTSLDAYLR
jgi:UV DNA damage repair endonuclease